MAVILLSYRAKTQDSMFSDALCERQWIAVDPGSSPGRQSCEVREDKLVKYGVTAPNAVISGEDPGSIVRRCLLRTPVECRGSRIKSGMTGNQARGDRKVTSGMTENQVQED